MNLDSYMPSRIFLSLLPLILLSIACAGPGYSIPVRSMPLEGTLPTGPFGSAQLDAGSSAMSTSVQSGDGKAGTASADRIKSRSSMLIFFGARHFSDGALWDPVDDQQVLGSEFDWIAANGVFGFEIGFQASFADEDELSGASTIDLDGGATELYVGPRFDTTLFGSSFHLVAGVGPSLLRARLVQEINGSSRTDAEASLGLYAHLGLILDLGDFGLGLDYRQRWGEDMTGFEDVFGTKVTGDADYSQLALTVSLLF